jgi:hypothetical protein
MVFLRYLRTFVVFVIAVQPWLVRGDGAASLVPA